MASTKPTAANQTSEPTSENKERTLTIAERLARSGEVFCAGFPDASDRTARKLALYDYWDERR
jgi:hypothetical protein